MIRPAFAILLLAAAGCASEPGAAERAAAENRFAPANASADAAECFSARNINGFSEVDRDTVRLRVGQDSYYDVTVSGTCFDLEWADRLAVVSRNGNFMCVGPAFGDGALITRDDNCSILRIDRSPLAPADAPMTPFTAAEA